MITALPSLSKSCESLKRSVLNFSFARPFSITNSTGRSPACSPWGSEVGLRCPPAEKNGTTSSVAGSTASGSHLPVVCRWKPWNCPRGTTSFTLAWTSTLPPFVPSKRTTPTKSPSTSFMRAVAPASVSLRELGPEPTLISGTTTSNATSATSAPSAPNDAKLPLIYSLLPESSYFGCAGMMRFSARVMATRRYPLPPFFSPLDCSSLLTSPCPGTLHHRRCAYGHLSEATLPSASTRRPQTVSARTSHSQPAHGWACLTALLSVGDE